jgi:hypothetical protein
VLPQVEEASKRLIAYLCRMEFIEALRSSASDAFLTLPLLVIGFLFFLGTLTSNTGLLYLFVGHLIVVPALSFLANDKGTLWLEQQKDGSYAFSLLKIAKYLFSFLFLLGIQGNAMGGDSAYSVYVAFPLIAVLQWMLFKKGNPVSPLGLINPGQWFLKPNEPEGGKPASTCSIVPNADPTDTVYTSPSNWITHMTFFFGFLFNNALAIYNQPTPKLSGAVDEATRQDRENRLALRVRNRKWLTTMIMIALAFAYAVLLFFRYMKTPCEAGFLYSLVPTVIIGLTGAAWFQFVYNSCGVRPADVLGIVQGMISPDMVDNPIVCVGS